MPHSPSIICSYSIIYTSVTQQKLYSGLQFPTNSIYESNLSFKVILHKFSNTLECGWDTQHSQKCSGSSCLKYSMDYRNHHNKMYIRVFVMALKEICSLVESLTTNFSLFFYLSGNLMSNYEKAVNIFFGLYSLKKYIFSIVWPDLELKEGNSQILLSSRPFTACTDLYWWPLLQVIFWIIYTL